MTRLERLVLYTLDMMLATLLVALLAACGAPAGQAPTLEPTQVFPTRVPIQPTSNVSAGGRPTAVAVQPTVAPTLAPNNPPATPIPPTPTRSFATVTPVVTATVVQPAASTGPAGNAASGVSSNSANGKAIFQNGIGDPAVPACSTCHNADTPDVKIGPSLQGVASRAGSWVPGQDAATYLHTSILQPNAFLVPNEDGHVFSAAGTSLMFQDYAKHLSDAQVNDLVAYLLTLK